MGLVNVKDKEGCPGDYGNVPVWVRSPPLPYLLGLKGSVLQTVKRRGMFTELLLWVLSCDLPQVQEPAITLKHGKTGIP